MYSSPPGCISAERLRAIDDDDDDIEARRVPKGVGRAFKPIGTVQKKSPMKHVTRGVVRWIRERIEGVCGASLALERVEAPDCTEAGALWAQRKWVRRNLEEQFLSKIPSSKLPGYVCHSLFYLSSLREHSQVMSERIFYRGGGEGFW